MFFGQRRGRLSPGVAALRLESENAPLPNCAGFTGDRSFASFASGDLTPATQKILTQGFLLHFIQSQAAARAHPGKGRFRDFLVGALEHYLIDSQTRAQTPLYK